jgi:hypothetical protein
MSKTRACEACCRKLGYSLQANVKVRQGAAHPDPNAQLEHFSAQTDALTDANEPAISDDTKKKELVGDFKNGGARVGPKRQTGARASRGVSFEPTPFMATGTTRSSRAYPGVRSVTFARALSTAVVWECAKGQIDRTESSTAPRDTLGRERWDANAGTRTLGRERWTRTLGRERWDAGSRSAKCWIAKRETLERWKANAGRRTLEGERWNAIRWNAIRWNAIRWLY